MKEIFEKIIRDSVESLVEGAMNELGSKRKKDNEQKEGVRYDDKDEYYEGSTYISSEEKCDRKYPIKEEVEFPQDYRQAKSEYPEYKLSNEIGVINAYSRNKRLNIMVACAAIGLVLCMLILTSYRGNLPGEVIGIISTVSGIFGACLKDAYSFEFGSSRGSKDKDDKISATILDRLKR